MFLTILNTFHKNIQFTYKLGIKNETSFLDFSLNRKNETLGTKIYRMNTDYGVYHYWD